MLFFGSFFFAVLLKRKKKKKILRVFKKIVFLSPYFNQKMSILNGFSTYGVLPASLENIGFGMIFVERERERA
jgi:hypothetical protein